MSRQQKGTAFTANSIYSIGVEIEFQILDKQTLNLSPQAPVLLRNSPQILSSRITHELIRSILELQTGVCSNLRDVENDLMETCSMAEELAQENGCLLYAASLHPFAHYSEQILTENDRYKRIMAELQIVGRRFISQGLHVHVGLPDGDTAIRVCNIIQHYLPLLLSISTSSPYFCGQDTGLLSYRTKLFEALPLAGIFEHYRDWNDFIEDVDRLMHYGVIESLNDLWWDARPNARFGTVEVRICDLPGRFSDILAVVAFIQAFIAYIVEERHAHAPVSLQLLRANKWQALRHGLDGFFIDPSGFLAGEKISTRKAIDLLLAKILPYAHVLKSLSYLHSVQRILDCGSSAHYQKKLYQESGSFSHVIQQIYEEFWQ